jgi:hypothetical protein
LSNFLQLGWKQGYTKLYFPMHLHTNENAEREKLM